MTHSMKFAAVGIVSMMAIGGAASAADLGRPAPAAVDYVRVCDAYGQGFFYIPGSETCLRIGGAVRMDVSYAERAFYSDLRRLGNGLKLVYGNNYRQTIAKKNWNRLATLVRGRVDVDARTNTEYGLLRSFIDVEYEVGSFHEPIDPVSLAPRNTRFQRTVLRQAFIQWGGWTAGHTYSLFNLPFFLTYSNPFTADQRTTMLAYTFAQNGFSASLALEDPSVRRGVLLFPDGADIAGFLNGARSNYGGVKYPDIVGTVKFDNQAFSLQASGALHHVVHGGIPGTTPVNNGVDEWGWAAQIGGQFKFNSRGSIYAGVVRTEGASNFSGISSDDDRLGNGVGFGAIDGAYDFSRFGRTIDWRPVKITAAHIGAGYQITDTVRVAGSYGYARVEDDLRMFRRDNVGGGLVRTTAYDANYDLQRVVGLAEWSPVKDLIIGAEATYSMVDFDKIPSPPGGVKPRQQQYERDYDRFSALFRIQRKF